MLREKLSTNLASLILNQGSLAIVIEMVVGADKSIQNSDVYRSIVRNHGKLAYDRVAVLLEGSLDMPSEIAAFDGLAESANQMT